MEDHGLYEWNILEPALDAIICPLRFNLAGSEAEGTLAGRLDPAALAPGPTFYETLGVPTVVLQPRRIAGSAFTRLATRGASVRGFGGLDEGVQALTAAFAHQRGQHGPGYALPVLGSDRPGRTRAWPELARVRGREPWRTRCALERAWPDCATSAVLITADHGQVDVSPDRVDYLDDLWPALTVAAVPSAPCGLLARRLPARARGPDVETVIAELSARLGDGAEVRPAARAV